MEVFGGRDNYLEIYKGFYRDILADPFMNVLFDMSHKDTNVSPEEHGTRLGLFFLLHFGGDQAYTQLRGQNRFGNLEKAHKRAKNCPMRGNLKGKGFTVNQVYTWLGYMSLNMDKRGL